MNESIHFWNKVSAQKNTAHGFSQAVLSSSKEVYTHLRLHVLDDEAEDPPYPP